MAVQRIEDRDADLARRFLLRRLTGEESATFEARLLGDEQLFEIVRAVEDELLDEYVRGTLAEEERRVLASRFEQQPHRLRFAEALAQRAGAPSRATRRATWLWAAAAAILVVAGIAFWPRSTPEPTVPVVATETRETPTHVAVAPEKIATLTIALATTRDEAPVPKLTLANDVTSLALKIRLHPRDRYPTYLVEISRADGTNVWSGNTTTTTNELVVHVPATLLQPGDYAIAVTGIDAAGTREDLGDQAIRIVRSP